MQECAAFYDDDVEVPQIQAILNTAVLRCQRDNPELVTVTSTSFKTADGVNVLYAAMSKADEVGAALERIQWLKENQFA